MVSIITEMFPMELPLNAFNALQIVPVEENLNNLYDLQLVNPVTAPLFEAEWTKNNIKYMTQMTVGAFGIMLREPAANQDDLKGCYHHVSREGFHLAMDISVYSFTALAKAFEPILRSGSSMLTLTYYGGIKVAPNYNVMGVAKAALEASVRYLAYDFGPENIRVNAISAGPVKTLAASGVKGFRNMYNQFAEYAPLMQPIGIEDVGNTAVYLCSDLAAKTTGEIIYVDSGYNIIGVPIPRDDVDCE